MHEPLPSDAMAIKDPFLLYGQLRVQYDGRASSDLQAGNYLVLHKRDGSLLIHGSELVVPLNYQGAQSLLYRTTDRLICRSRKEQLVIWLDLVRFECQLSDWEHNKLTRARTEKQLRDKLMGNLADYIIGVNFLSIMAEAATEHGPVDILAQDDQLRSHIIEVKRAQATVSAAVQLRKYVEAHGAENVLGYLASPSIAPAALRYLHKHGFQYISIQHD